MVCLCRLVFVCVLTSTLPPHQQTNKTNNNQSDGCGGLLTCGLSAFAGACPPRLSDDAAGVCAPNQLECIYSQPECKPKTQCSAG